MIKLENKTYKTLIIKTKPLDISFSGLTIDQYDSKIEVIKSKDNTYIYISIRQSTPRVWSDLLKKELKLNLKDSVLLSKGDWIKAVNSIYYGEFQGKWPNRSCLTWGNKTIRYSIANITKEKKQSEGKIIKEIIDIFRSDESMKWKNHKDRLNILDALIPDDLYSKFINIKNQVESNLREKKTFNINLLREESSYCS